MTDADSTPPATLAAFERQPLPATWYYTDAAESENQHAELQRELPPGHLLYGVPVRTIAWREPMNDDVLFQHLNDPTRFTVVHLTWRGRTEVDKRFPTVELDGSFQHFLDEEAPWNDLAPEDDPPVDAGRAE